jgi:hypothetical protein
MSGRRGLGSFRVVSLFPFDLTYGLVVRTRRERTFERLATLRVGKSVTVPVSSKLLAHKGRRELLATTTTRRRRRRKREHVHGAMLAAEGLATNERNRNETIRLFIE